MPRRAPASSPKIGMPITFSIDHAARTMHAVAVGVITYPDVVEHLADEGRRGALTYPELIDATDAELAFTPVDVRRLVDDLRRLGRAGMLGPTAVVVTSEFAYGMLRMLETLVEDVTSIRPFRDRDEAMRWLEALRDVTRGG